MPQNNQQPQVNFTGMTGDNLFSIHTPQGAKWLKVGQSFGGYLISGYDKQSKQLQITQNGRHYLVPMSAGTVKEYIPPSQSIQHPYTTDPSAMSVQDQSAKDAINGAGATSDLEQQFQDVQNYKFSDAEFDNIWNNSQKSSYMTDEQKGNIFSFDAYHRNLKEGKLKPDTDYFIPKRLPDGGVDFDIFRYKTGEGE